MKYNTAVAELVLVALFSPPFLPHIWRLENKKSRNSQPAWVNPFLLLIVFFQKIKKYQISAHIDETMPVSNS